MAEGAWPSPKEVRDDLVKVRQGFGIRYESMLLIDHLPRLRVVHNEAARQERSLGTDARPIAYDVVRCVAHSDQLLGERLKRVAVVTLNFEQAETSLTERRDQLQAEFRISEGAYKKLESRTFQQLVGVLLSLDTSPCASPEQSSKDAAGLERQWQALADFDAVRFVEMGFARLRFSRDHESAVKEAERILERIPKGVAKVTRADNPRPRDPRQTLMIITRRIARSIYDEWVRLGVYRDELDGDLLVAYLDNLRWGDLQVEATALERALEARGSVKYPFSRADLQEIDRMNNNLQPTFDVIAEIMIELESKNAWRITMRPTGAQSATMLP